MRQCHRDILKKRPKFFDAIIIMTDEFYACQLSHYDYSKHCLSVKYEHFLTCDCYDLSTMRLPVRVRPICYLFAFIVTQSVAYYLVPHSRPSWSRCTCVTLLCFFDDCCNNHIKSCWPRTHWRVMFKLRPRLLKVQHLVSARPPLIHAPLKLSASCYR